MSVIWSIVRTCCVELISLSLTASHTLWHYDSMCLVCSWKTWLAAICVTHIYFRSTSPWDHCSIPMSLRRFFVHMSSFKVSTIAMYTAFNKWACHVFLSSKLSMNLPNRLHTQKSINVGKTTKIINDNHQNNIITRIRICALREDKFI